MAALALAPAVVDVIDTVLTEGGGVAIEELVVPNGTAELSAGDLRRSGASLLAVRTVGGSLAVGPDDAQRVSSGDLIVAMGTRQQLTALASALAPPAQAR